MHEAMIKEDHTISTRKQYSKSIHLTAWKVPVFGVILVHIFPHSDWIRKDTLRKISPYSVRMRENADQNKSEYGHILRSASKSSGANSFLKILAKFLLNHCEDTHFLGDLDIKSLNFPTDYISLQIWYMQSRTYCIFILMKIFRKGYTHESKPEP